MKITLDTNVLIAALLARGTCHDLFEHVILNHELVSSEFILEEFGRVLEKNIRIHPTKAGDAASLIREHALLVPDAALEEAVSRDPDDDWVLSVAASSRSACLVSGDNDLLSIGSFRGIPIIKPVDFWAFEQGVK